MRHVNLLRDGWEAAADRLSHRLRHARGAKVLAVRQNGLVAVYEPHKYKGAVADVVGLYDRRVRVEHLEDDLLDKLRNLNTPPADTLATETK